jgi:hypothetical protein
VVSFQPLPKNKIYNVNQKRKLRNARNNLFTVPSILSDQFLLSNILEFLTHKKQQMEGGFGAAAIIRIIALLTFPISRLICFIILRVKTKNKGFGTRTKK